MKILLYITSHQQVEEYNYFAQFLKRLQINTMCDIFIYCNSPHINPQIVTYYQSFDQPNKRLHITTLNAGYRVGGAEAVSQGFEMGIFQEYDYVIHLHPDVYMTDDEYLLEILRENLQNDIGFFVNRSVPNDERFFSFDFFIFKPRVIPCNILKEELYTFTSLPENYLYDMIHKYQIKYKIVKRFNNNLWCPRRIDENLKLYHEHDLDEVRRVFEETKKNEVVSYTSISKCQSEPVFFEM